MNKLLYLFLVIGSICWGIGMQVFSAHAASRSVQQSQAASAPIVALTFDDGPQPTYTPQILSVLERYGVKASFFCIGEQVKQYPDVVQQAFRAGNMIGNHSWSHPMLTGLSPDAIRKQLNDTSLAIQQATGASPSIFRPPYDATNATIRNIASQLGMHEYQWTIDTLDWTRPGVDAIVKTALSGAKNGSIILMHDGGGDRSQTVQALPQIIQGLKQRGFTFVVV